MKWPLQHNTLSIRLRMWVVLALLAIATMAVGTVAWFALDRADRELETLHQQTLSGVARALALSKRSADMATSAPYLLNLNSPAQVQREGGSLLRMIEEAVLDWSSPDKNAFGALMVQGFSDALSKMRQAILDLLDASADLDIAQDKVSAANNAMSELRNRISGEMEAANENPVERLNWLALQSMANYALGAGFAGNHIGLGEYQRNFNDQTRAARAAGLGQQQTIVFDDILSRTQAPDGIFEMRRRELNLNLEAQNALFRIRHEANVMNALTASYAESAEAYLTSRRGDTLSSITFAKSVILAVGLASTLVALLAAFHVSSYVTGNISRIAGAMTRLASGDRKSTLPRMRENADEIGDLFRSFRTFRANALRLDRSNSQLYQRNALLEKVFDNMTDGVAVTDETGKVRYSNPNFRKIVRLDIGTVQTGDVEALLHSTHFGQSAKEKEIGISFRGTAELVSDNGQIVEVRANRLPDEGRVWLLSDVTERRQLDERLNQIRRIEALGKVTGEVAHDFGNILSTIASNAHMLKKGATPEKTATLRQRIVNAVEIGTSLTQRLLAFARKQQLAPETIELNSLIEGLVDLISVGLDDGATLVTELSDQPIYVRVDPGQLESAILNLCLNANQAIENTGCIAIKTTGPESGSATIEVADDGIGMDEDTVAHALEPFFSARTDGEGNGLGLSMVYGFMKQTGGDMTIVSAIGEGTSVKLILPACIAPANNIAGKLSAPRALVVEDDRVMLDTISRHLEAFGFHVLRAGSYETGAELLAGEKPFDLLSTDLQLENGTSGWDLVSIALSNSADTRIVVISGRLPKDHSLLRSHGNRIACVAKPVTRETLKAAINFRGMEKMSA